MASTIYERETFLADSSHIAKYFRQQLNTELSLLLYFCSRLPWAWKIVQRRFVKQTLCEKGEPSNMIIYAFTFKILKIGAPRQGQTTNKVATLNNMWNVQLTAKVKDNTETVGMKQVPSVWEKQNWKWVNFLKTCLQRPAASNFKSWLEKKEELNNWCTQKDLIITYQIKSGVVFFLHTSMALPV